MYRPAWFGFPVAKIRPKPTRFFRTVYFPAPTPITPTACTKNPETDRNRPTFEQTKHKTDGAIFVVRSQA